MEQVNMKLDKVIEVTKSVMRNEVKGITILNEKARIWVEEAPSDKEATGNR